jgi:hypothetical protein
MKTCGLSFIPFAAADLILRHSSVLWRHWRTMAFLASPSMRLRKTDGLLARAGELCRLIGASYISPCFPLVLGFELWRYLRPQVQTGDRSVLTRNNREMPGRRQFRAEQGARPNGLRRNGGFEKNSKLSPAGTAENRPRRNPEQPSAVPAGLNGSLTEA